MNSIFALIKFGQKKHLENLMYSGQLRFGSLEGFANSTEKERGDKFEGATNILNEQFIKIECDHPEIGKHTFIPVSQQLGRMINFSDEPYFSYSTYALTSDCFVDSNCHVIDKRMSEFGEFALVIREPSIFLDRVKRKLHDLNMIHQSKLINYKDFEKKGIIETNLFTKTTAFKHQFEYRILAKADKKQEAIYIEIGAIKDFCFLSKTQDLLKVPFYAKRN
jgi:hypothetical protein